MQWRDDENEWVKHVTYTRMKGEVPECELKRGMVKDILHTTVKLGEMSFDD